MKISFTTLGCPEWDLDTICARAREYGYDGIDLRGYLDTLDVTTLPEFTNRAGETLRKLQDAKLEVSGISSSITVCQPEKRGENLEEARRTIDVARRLGVKNVRVFGGGNLEKSNRQELAKIGCEMVEEILLLDGAKEIKWLFETHDIWTKSQDCRLLLESIPDPAFGALWDIGHTPRIGGETPEQTIAAIGPRIGYTHIKDAVYQPRHPEAMRDGWRYVMPGEGSLPLAHAIASLKSIGYDGWLTFEHEKRWIPTLIAPDVAFAAYAHWAKKLK